MANPPFLFSGVLMPSWVANDDLWSKAKAQAKKSSPDDFYALATSIYKKMGGKIKKKSKQAMTPSAAGQLQRGREARLRKFESMAEAEVMGTRKIKCVLISEGPGNKRDRNYYTREAIQDASDRGVFEGVRCFLNHQSEAERIANPVNKVQNQAGYFEGTHFETVRGRAAIVGNLCLDESEAAQEVHAKAKASVDYKAKYPDTQETYAGLSINGGGALDGTLDIDGLTWNRVVRFEDIGSVDAVTRPARGGEFQAILESEAFSSEELMKKSVKKLKKEIKKVEAAIEAETDVVKRAKLQEDAADLKKHLVSKVMATPDEAPEDEEEEENEDIPSQLDDKDGEESEDDEEAEDEEMYEAMKKALPQADGEEDEAYEGKIKAAMKAAKLHGAGKKESLSVADFKKQYPRLAESLLNEQRQFFEDKGADLKETKKELRVKAEEAERLKADLRFYQDKETATRLLAEAGVPSSLCPIALLVGKDEATMRAEIGRTKKMLEAGNPGGAFAPARGGAGSPDDKSVKALVESSGLPMKRK